MTLADTLRQAMEDWNNATDAQRDAALTVAKTLADATDRRIKERVIERLATERGPLVPDPKTEFVLKVSRQEYGPLRYMSHINVCSNLPVTGSYLRAHRMSRETADTIRTNLINRGWRAQIVSVDVAGAAALRNHWNRSKRVED
jgi:hypothetical protein